LGDAAASAAFVQNWRFVATSPRPPLYWIRCVALGGGSGVRGDRSPSRVLLAHRWTRRTSPCLGPGDVRLRCVDGCPQRGSTPIVRAYAGPTPARRRSWWSDARGVASSGALFVTRGHGRPPLPGVGCGARRRRIGATVSWQDRGFTEGLPGHLGLTSARSSCTCCRSRTAGCSGALARVLTWPADGIRALHLALLRHRGLVAPDERLAVPGCLGALHRHFAGRGLVSWYLLESPYSAMPRFRRRKRPCQKPRPSRRQGWLSARSGLTGELSAAAEKRGARSGPAGGARGRARGVEARCPYAAAVLAATGVRGRSPP